MPAPPPDPSFGGPEPWPSSRFRPPVLSAEDDRITVRRRRRTGVHLGLFLATIASTILAGGHFFEVLPLTGSLSIAWRYTDLSSGLWYSATALAILGCHEMGHYLTCRYYGIDASLPYFLPAPILSGTLGAFIRIREPIRSKRVLFDIGVAGPIAGFLVALPATFIGVAFSQIVSSTPPPGVQALNLQEPLLFKAAEWLFWPHLAHGQTLALHPIGFGAWFGLLATALNLIPIGQLDGGHISYALLGRRSTAVTFVGILAAIVLSYFSWTWVVWTILMVAMIVVFGPRHPPTLDEHVPLDRRRVLVALAAVVIFAVCFMPAPLSIVEGGR